MMTTPASAIKDQIRELIHLQIEIFGQPNRLTSSELIECHYRTERISQLGQELDRIGKTAILENQFGRAS
jgi:hypothetical protein